METSTKNTLIKTIIPAAVTLFIGIVGLSKGSDIVHEIMNNTNTNNNTNNNTITVFSNGEVREYSADDIKNLEEDNQNLNNEVTQLLSTGYRYKEYGNIQLYLNGSHRSLTSYSICTIMGVNYYSEDILKAIDDVNISFDIDEHALYINKNE